MEAAGARRTSLVDLLTAVVLLCGLTGAGIMSACGRARAAAEARLAPRFEDVTAQAGLEQHTRTFAAVFSDLDGDGDDDLLVCRHGRGPSLFLNRDGLHFEEASSLLPRTLGDRHGVTVIDLDNDGDRDVVIAGGGADGIGQGTPNLTMQNLLVETGALGFKDISDQSGLGLESRYRSRALLPIASQDGSLVDLYLTTRARDGFSNELFHNRSSSGKVRFEVDPDSSLRDAWVTEGMDLFVDIDRDGDQDLFLLHHGRLVFLRQEDGVYTRVRTVVEDHRWVQSVAAGDLDNDGYPDLFLGCTSGYSRGDQLVHSSRRVHFLFTKEKGETGADEEHRDGLTFVADDGSIIFDLAYKPGLAVHDPSSIYIGSDMRNPRAVKMTLTAENAAGAPPRFASQGVHIWYDPTDGAWTMLWIAAKGERPLRGVIHGRSIRAVQGLGLERIDPPNRGEDCVLRNSSGILEHWEQMGRFGHRAETAALLIADLDNDGFQDLVGLRRLEPGGGSDDPFVLKNIEGRRLEAVPATGLLTDADDLFNADQLIAGLVNKDGLLDLFTTNGWGVKPGSSGPLRLLMNTTRTANHFLVLELEGRRSNRDAIGAQVEVRDQQGLLLGYRELGAGYHRSQSTHQLHFGLGSRAAPVEVTVRWPIGAVSRHRLDVDRRHHLLEPAAPAEVVGADGQRALSGPAQE